MQALGENEVDHGTCFNPQPLPIFGKFISHQYFTESTYLQDMGSVPFNLVEHRLLNIPEAHHPCGLPAKAGQGSSSTLLEVTPKPALGLHHQKANHSRLDCIQFLLLQVESKRQESVNER